MSMHEDESASRTRGSERDPATGERGGSEMCARTWVVASQYYDPTDYGIPELPEWTISRPHEAGVAFAETSDAEPFISARQPMRVRR